MGVTDRFSTSRPRRTLSRVGKMLVLACLVGVGCGGASGPDGTALIGGMPRCDASLLHPLISVGSVAGQPGKTIVYVDGVMACVDDSARVDQIVAQLETRSADHK